MMEGENRLPGVVSCPPSSAAGHMCVGTETQIVRWNIFYFSETYSVLILFH